MLINKSISICRFLCVTIKNCRWVFVSLLALFWACTPSVPIPPPVKDTGSLPQARLEIRSDGLLVKAKSYDSPSIVPVQSRSFNTTEEFVQFAERTLGAEAIRRDGKVIAVKVQYHQVGKVVFENSDGTFFSQDDFIAAYLGGLEGTFRIGDREIRLKASLKDSTISNITTSIDTCDGSDCVRGETWYDDYGFYKSVGGKTIQVSGGYGTHSYLCCEGGGELLTIGGSRQCQGRILGKWKYDSELGVWLPEGLPPYYTYREPDVCSYPVRNNTLRLSLTLLYPDKDPVQLIPKDESNVPEVASSASIFWFKEDSPELDIWGVNRICGIHVSTHGGRVRTSAGRAGYDPGGCPQ